MPQDPQGPELPTANYLNSFDIPQSVNPGCTSSAYLSATGRVSQCLPCPELA